jgi:hypothetical protein
MAFLRLAALVALGAGTSNSERAARALQPATQIKWYASNGSWVPVGRSCDDAHPVTGLLPRPDGPITQYAGMLRPLRLVPVDNGAGLLVLGLHAPRTAATLAAPRGDVLRSDDAGASWRCVSPPGATAAGGTSAHVVAAGAAAFVVAARNVSLPDGRVVSVEAVCVAGGRLLSATGDDYGPPVSDVGCYLNGSLAWTPAAPLPFNVTGLTHVAVDTVVNVTVAAGGALSLQERPRQYSLLLGGWRDDNSEDVLVALFPPPDAREVADNPALLALPTGWARLPLGTSLLQRARPLAAWMANYRQVAMAGGFVRLEGGAADGSAWSPPLLAPSVPLSRIDLDVGDDVGDGAIPLDDMLALDVLPLLDRLGDGPPVPGGGSGSASPSPSLAPSPSPAASSGASPAPTSVNVTRIAQLRLPETRPPPATDGSFTLTTDRSRNLAIGDVFVLQAGRRVHTALWSPSYTLSAFTEREHLVYGTPAALAGAWPEVTDHAPGSMVTVPLGVAGARDPGFLLAVDAATGAVFRGTMMPCQSQGCLPPMQYTAQCVYSPFDSYCAPCTQCAASGGYDASRCGGFRDAVCAPCTPCPPGQAVLVPCPLPRLPLGDMAQQLCAAQGRPAVLALPQQRALGLLVAVEAAAGALALLAVGAWWAVAAASELDTKGGAGADAAASPAPLPGKAAPPTTSASAGSPQSGVPGETGNSGGGGSTRRLDSDRVLPVELPAAAAVVRAALDDGGAVSSSSDGSSSAATGLSAAARAASAAAAVAPLSVKLRSRAALAALTITRVLAAAVTLSLLLGLAAGTLAKADASRRSNGELLLAGSVIAVALVGSATVGGVLVAASASAHAQHPLRLWQALTTRPLRALAVAAVVLPQPHMLLEAYTAHLRTRDRASAGVTMAVGPAAARLAVLRRLTLAALLLVNLPLLACATAYVAFARDVTRLSGLEFVADNGAEVDGGILIAVSALTLLLALTADAAAALVGSRHSLRTRLFARSTPAAAVERSPLHLLVTPSGSGGVSKRAVRVTDYAAPAAAAGTAAEDVVTASPVFAARAVGAAVGPNASPARAIVVAQQHKQPT